jgi:hypothetical protein
MLVCALAGCGRLGFASRNAGTNDGSSADTATAASVSYVGVVIAQQGVATGTVDSFAAQAQQAGDLFVLAVECDNGGPTSVTVDAPGWSVAVVGPIAHMAANRSIASFAATAPDTTPTTFTVNWFGTAACGGLTELANEFATTSGSLSVDGHAEALSGTGSPSATVTTASDDDAIWAACSSAGSLLAVGAGFSKGADDGHDDWSEYELASGPAGPHTVMFASAGAQSAVAAIAIAAR